MKTGFSIYLSSGMEQIESIIHQAKNAGATQAFTSLHIPEENYGDYKKNVLELFRLTNEAGIGLMIDVEGETPARLGLKRMEDLLDYGVTSIRLDYGFRLEDIVSLSKTFQIVWNASTISPFEIRKLEQYGADTGRFTACHNFYPKPYTGLSIERVHEMNSRLQMLGFNVAAFVPGDEILRGPLCEGLPTVEDHRFKKERIALNMLELYRANTNQVFIGDVNLSGNGWQEFKSISEGVIPLRTDLSEAYSDLYDRTWHERADSSPYVVRLEESRAYFAGKSIPASDTGECEPGAVCIGNDAYLRYKGEVEICRRKRASDSRVNVIGKVCNQDLEYIPFIENGMGIQFLRRQ